ncbi:hypothetical protein M23134_01598 [Microscilla marina ATCC 23134]|uniref:Uncharacterized protein n=1 Tax=Microscilla marina ATCC 23134 TaxID=313606 RepID=A1ZTL5_MICM2|nr:hypothetical protein M23134_01598 [Microscilla marina ATCC 23134]
MFFCKNMKVSHPELASGQDASAIISTSPLGWLGLVGLKPEDQHGRGCFFG